MAKFLSKHLGKVALMTAAALWASCSAAKDEKADTLIAEEPQATQTEDFKDSLKDIRKNADSKYIPSRKMDTAGVTALYGCISRGNGRIVCGNRPIDTVLDTSAKCLYGTCSGGGVAAKSNANVTIPGEPDIEITGEISNAKPHVLKVVQARTPGLRHIYRKHLKKKTGFNGTVILDLKINANGDVENVVTKSSTTSYQEFDAEIVKAVSRWKFSKSKTGGNMTIPLNFQEYGPTPSKEN
jgi:TonB family protein